MTNLAVRTENKAQQTPVNGSQPLRLFRELLNWDPFREMEPFLLSTDRAFMPAFEVSESTDSYLFKADLPGIKDSDVKISVTGNRLLVTGKRESSQEQKSATYYVCERSYGEFSRAFTLPEGADTEHVKADLSSGVLSIAIPKKPGAQTKQIPLQSEKAK